MGEARPITIIGGGLAGLTLGIGLRQHGVPVIIWEAGHYPRHRVCGEFISGRGQNALCRLGLKEVFIQAGAIAARTAALFLGKARSQTRALTPPALCLSRFAMDALLAQHFRNSGGELRASSRWRAAHSDEGIVFASGRRPSLAENGWHWFGVKAHARDVDLEADLEMHAVAAGYVGLCRLADGEVNVCGLFRKRVNDHLSIGSWQQLLRGAPGTVLHTRVEKAAFEPNSFCSVAGLGLKSRTASDQPDFCIGDNLTMIPPVAGNGMSMAFEAAEFAVSPLAAYSRGDLSWNGARKLFARTCDAAFATRLRWANALQWFMFARVLPEGLAALALRSEFLWQLMFAKTR